MGKPPPAPPRPRCLRGRTGRTTPRRSCCASWARSSPVSRGSPARRDDRGRRFRGRRGKPAAAGAQPPARASADGRCEDAHPRGRGAVAERRRALGTHRAGRRQPAVPPRARVAGGRGGGGRGAAGDRRGARSDAHRPARPERPHAAALGIRPRRLLLGSPDRRGAGGRAGCGRRFRGVGPAR